MRHLPEDGRVVWSASDLKAAAECEFAWVRELDGKLGRAIPVVDEVRDAMLERAIVLGEGHELRQLAAYRASLGPSLVEIERGWEREKIDASLALTEQALRTRAPVVYQAAFEHADFIGFADFLVLGPDERYVVQDTKLARRAKVTALMQLAAYVDQLDRLGVARADTVELILGDGTVSVHRVDDIMPVFRLRRGRIRAIIAEQDPAAGAEGPIVAWGDERYQACGRCDTCLHEIALARDLHLVAGLRRTQREKLRAAGIETIEQLASATAVPRMDAATLAGLSRQARLQLESEADQRAADRAPGAVVDPVPPRFAVSVPDALSAIPEPDTGDIFFDFEGDPLHTEGDGAVWGIDYLWGWVDAEAGYGHLWSHTFAQEREALIAFLAFVKERRQRHPGMHIFHYAPYERTHLLEMARRHAVGEADVDQLLADGVLVDLYPIVRRAVTVGSASYSIKKLEPLYMGASSRDGMSVAQGAESIEAYLDAMSAEPEQRRELLEELRAYNEYDCVSTLRLRDWLLSLARAAGVPPRPPLEESRLYEEPEIVAALRRLLPADALAIATAGDHGGRTTDEAAIALAAAAVAYFPREWRTYWAHHHLRLEQPMGHWANTRDVMIVDLGESHVAEDWHADESGRRSRTLTLHGEIAPGTRYGEGMSVYALYEQRSPLVDRRRAAGSLIAHYATIVAIEGDVVTLREAPWRVEGRDDELTEWSDLPVALAPAPGPSTDVLERAIATRAAGLPPSWPDFPRDAATDLLRRVPAATVLPSAGHADYVDAIMAALRGMDRGYLAVQGPPGTGKTFVGSHVIAGLLADSGWKIGVVAQSHAVVDNMLGRVIEVGADPERVAKVGGSAAVAGVEPLKSGTAGTYLLRHQDGAVIGGTAWLFASDQFRSGALDLLVIDEAGQFGLAATFAAAGCARRILLLGDPQQLPQVSQGTHPEPVDESALGWLIGDHDVLPAEYGYFLAETWRMRPELARPVSELSYEGELAAHPSATLREVEGLAPGLHLSPVAHRGNASHSPEEAQRVVEIVQSVLGREWTDRSRDPDAAARPLGESDVIVLAPYNAQLAEIRDALDGAGLRDVPVGTVDRFQGQEAAIAIYSLAASSAADAPRGLEFVLLRNRINVAISRAKYAAWLVYSPALLDELPHTPEGVSRLSAFARLVSAVPDDGGVPASASPPEGRAP